MTPPHAREGEGGQSGAGAQGIGASQGRGCRGPRGRTCGAMSLKRNSMMWVGTTACPPTRYVSLNMAWALGPVTNTLWYPANEGGRGGAWEGAPQGPVGGQTPAEGRSGDGGHSPDTRTQTLCQRYTPP